MASEFEIPYKKPKIVRNINWTSIEKDIIVEQCSKQAAVLHGAISCHLTMAMKNKVWEEITSKVNAAGGANRTLDQVKTKWKNLRSRSVEKVRDFKRESTKTGKYKL